MINIIMYTHSWYKNYSLQCIIALIGNKRPLGSMLWLLTTLYRISQYYAHARLHPNSSYTRDYCELIEWILVVDPETRPSIEEVQVRIESMLRAQQTTDEESS